MRELSVPAVIDIRPEDHLTGPLWANAEKTPTAVAVLRDAGRRWSPITCAALKQEVVGVARGLIAAGIAPGDRVALMSRTRYEWTLIDYAIWAVGAVTVPVYETSSPAQVEWILRDSAAVACFVESGAHADIVTGVRGQLPALTQLWQIEAGAVEALIAAGTEVDADQVEQRRRAARVDDVATIIYTSGTTGTPKGCALSHRNMYADIANALPLLGGIFDRETSTLLFLPLAHAFARLIQIGAIQAQAQLGHTADLLNLPATFKEFRPTFILSVPRVFEKVYNSARQKADKDGKGAIFARAEKIAIGYSEAQDTGGPGIGLRLEHALFDKLVYGKLRAALGGRCTAAMSGGAPLGARLAHFFRGVGVTVYEGYGLTETSPAISVNVPGAVKLGTVGRPLPGVTVRIAEDGEILVRGDIVFRGYWDGSGQPVPATDPEGWLHTGDLGNLDDGGFLTITGRKKELIVTAGGKNVAPAALEDRVRAHPLVSQCMVIGDQRPFIAALVTIDEAAWPGWLESAGQPSTATIADLCDDPALRATIQTAIDDANAAVSQAEAIRSFRVLPRDFTEATGELTPSLKVKRQVVLDMYPDEVAALYTRR